MGQTGEEDHEGSPRLPVLKTADIFPPGQVLEERYRIVRLVGRGGSGEVYEAEDLRGGGQVAIKTVTRERLESPRALRRFERERNFSQRISHPNVLEIFELFKVPVEVDQASGTTTVMAPCMAMEFLKGETLADRFQRGERFTPEEAKPLVCQMASALDAAHRLGIVHRDLKPDNIFLVPEGDEIRVVVTDFGVARQAIKRKHDQEDSMTRSDVILGTPDYMAPEQLDLEKAMPPTDIYTLGIVMFEMITGHHPFEADKAIDRVFKRVKEPAPSPRRYVPDIDPMWEDTILRCLRRKPEERFPNALGIVKALDGKIRSRGAAADSRRRQLWTAALVVFFVAMALAVLLLTGCGPGRESSRVLVLGLDGLDPRTIDLLMSEGKMPHFAKLRQEGAYGRLLSQEPLLSPIIWTTIATGKGPEEHGIGHFVAQTSDTGESIPASSDLRKVKAMWNIASDAGKQVATVGWWATWPPEEVDGSVVSDHTAYHFLFEEGFATTDSSSEERRTYPPELAERIAPLLRRPGDLSFEELERFVNVEREDFDRPFDFDDDLAHFRWALATAQSYRDIGLELWREDRPDLALVYVEGTDSTSHLFGHLFRAEGLGGELAEQQRKFGRTVEEIYLFADELLGEFLDAMDDRTTLLVLSDHGFELGALHDDPTRTRTMRRVSERFHRIEGILYLYGHRVKEHARIDRPSILDITPTVLALLGIPPARDMPGRVLQEAFTAEIGRDRVVSHEDGAGGDRAAPADGELDLVRQAQLEHLKSLGYLDDSESDEGAGSAAQTPEALRNLAAINFQAGKFREAAEIYRNLIEEDPENAALRASLAGTLGALELYDQALEQLEEAIRLEPLNIEAYHNRAVIHERQGNLGLAVADYRTALRYQPSYEPSQRALYRLTGEASVHLPADAAEQRAAELVEQASLAARRANYDEAIRLLDEAERVAPTYILIYQYRSNVAYLMGDQAGAIAALEKGLEIEPDNALFQTNLERLRSGNGG